MIDKNYKWYVLFVRTNHENKVRNILNRLNIESYLPLIKELRYWSDRKKWMERPLFPGYIFLRVSCREFFSVMDNNSVISYVKEGQNPASISEDQISMIRQVEASGNGLQLNGNVGNDADNGHYGHDRPQGRALAVSRRYKIGDGGNVLGLADTNDLPEHQPPQGDHQGRADIDGQETGSRSYCAPHTAVECPGRTVHSHGKGVDVGVAGNAAADAGHPVPVIGNSKQQSDIGKRKGDEDSGCNHN